MLTALRTNLRIKSSAVRRVIASNNATVATRSCGLSTQAAGNDNEEPTTTTTATPLSSFSPDKMNQDKRYAGTLEVPESLLQKPHEESKFSIQGQFREGRAAYLDASSTTPLDPRVLDAMLPYMIGSYGNPHSRTHQYGWEAETVVEKARQQVADLIKADSKEIIFTSGATESNNLAIKGAAHFYAKRGKHIITTQTEHKCVLDSCRFLEQEGYEVTYLPVQHHTGRVNMDELKAAIRDDTILISVMAVNNEIGTLQPISEIGELCRERKIVFHCDAAQVSSTWVMIDHPPRLQWSMLKPSSTAL